MQINWYVAVFVSVNDELQKYFTLCKFTEKDKLDNSSILFMIF